MCRNFRENVCAFGTCKNHGVSLGETCGGWENLVCGEDNCCDCTSGYTKEGYCKTAPDEISCNCVYNCNNIGSDCHLECDEDCGKELTKFGTDSCDNNCPDNATCNNGVCSC